MAMFVGSRICMHECAWVLRAVLSRPWKEMHSRLWKIWQGFMMLVKYECLKVGQTFCYFGGTLWEAAINALAKPLCSVLNAFCSARYFYTVSRIDQGFHHHVTCSVPYLHVQNWNHVFTGGSCDVMLYACSTMNSLMYIAGYPRGLSKRHQRRKGRAGKGFQSLNKYVCVQNPTLCPGLLGINDYSAVYFGILYKCLIRS